MAKGDVVQYRRNDYGRKHWLRPKVLSFIKHDPDYAATHRDELLEEWSEHKRLDEQHGFPKRRNINDYNLERETFPKYIMIILESYSLVQKYTGFTESYHKVMSTHPEDSNISMIFYVDQAWVEPLKPGSTYNEEYEIYKKQVMANLRKKWAKK